MVLIKSISGIRGTIFRKGEENLTPFFVLKFVSVFGRYIIKKNSNPKIILGRDGRVSGSQISKLASNHLCKMGIDVIELGLTTTPTVGLYVRKKNASGGIMISASHNPIEWNALKFFNEKGEFITKKESDYIINYDFNEEFNFSMRNKIGSIIIDNNAVNYHISSILKLKEVLVQKIKSKNFKIVVDGINSSGGVFVIQLLEKLNVTVVELNCKPTGIFSHNPEPIPKNLKELSSLVVSENADFGIAVDPDVDRLVFVCEDGSFFGEEYTIIALANYILSNKKGNTVSNLSSSNGLRDVTIKLGGNHFYSPVGESNVIHVMKKNNAIFGGEGSGGVIFPKLHYGRDALIGIALFLSFLSKSGSTCKEVRNNLPNYFMYKDKILLSKKFNFESFKDSLMSFLKQNDTVRFVLIDGLRVNYNCGSWIHVRQSNTEPVIRVIIESNTKKRLKELKDFINLYINKLF